MMSEALFWSLIEQSKEERSDFSHQLQLMTNRLATFDEVEIIEFERKLREVLAESAHYNLIAAAKIVSGYVSDDSFLYFRCRLIAEGKEFFFAAIENPDVIATKDIPDLEYEGEDLLYVADNAFLLKFGEDTEKDLPRDIAVGYLDYHTEEDIKSEDWEEEDLPVKYPELWQKYSNVPN